jgi:CHASE3 domain sensor protein
VEIVRGSDYDYAEARLVATLRRLQLTPEEKEFLLDMDRLNGWPLTEQEENLSLEQARVLGEI